jgi:transcriptional regulator with XRE-family HTH domain
LLESWKDHDYRVQFVRERVQSSVALQIRSLREQRNGMTQTQLGKLMGKAQPWISQIENPEYGKWSIATLLDCAEAFDSDLEIKFRPFSRSLYELSRQDQQYFEVRSFEEELPELEEAATSGWVASTGRWTDITRATALLYPPSQSSFPPVGTNSYVQWVAPQPIPGAGFNAYQMSAGKPNRGVVEEAEDGEREKNKRRRATKGNLKRAA